MYNRFKGGLQGLSNLATSSSDTHSLAGAVGLGDDGIPWDMPMGMLKVQTGGGRPANQRVRAVLSGTLLSLFRAASRNADTITITGALAGNDFSHTLFALSLMRPNGRNGLKYTDWWVLLPYMH